MPANANCGLWRPIARLPAASVPAGGPTATPLSDPSSAQQSDAVSMLMPLYDKRYRDKLRSHRVEQLHTVKVTLKYPFGAFPNNLAHPGAQIVNPKLVERWGKEFTRHATGTGPYELVSWSADT